MCWFAAVKMKPASATPSRHRRTPIVCGKGVKAALTSRGQAANCFHSFLFLPQLPSSSSSDFQPWTVPSDQAPASTALHVNARQPSVKEAKEGGEWRDERSVNSRTINKRLSWSFEPLERHFVYASKRCRSSGCHQDEDGSRSWQRLLLITFRSLPLIREERLQSADRWPHVVRC